MRSLKYIIIITTLLFFREICLGAGLVVRPFPFFRQLPSNEIWAMYQDGQGFLWIGTTDGIARYDGFQTQTFKNDYRHPGWITDNRVVGFAETKENVWIGTAKGVTLFNKETWRLSPAVDKRLKDVPVYGITSGAENDVWIATKSLIYCCDRNGRIRKTYIPGGKKAVINNLYKDNGNRIWAVMDRGGLAYYNPTTDTFTRITGSPDIAFFTMLQDKDGRYWIGTWGNGLWEYFPGKTIKERFKKRPVTDKQGIACQSVFSIVQDDTYHYLWVLSYEGLATLEETSDGSLKTVTDNGITDPYKMFTRIFKDREGNLWISAYDRAFIVSFDNSGIQNYNLSELKNLCMYDANILNLCFKNGRLWMEQDRSGLFLWNEKNQHPVFINTDSRGIKYEAEMLCPSQSSDNVIWVSVRTQPRILKLERQGLKVKILEDISLEHITGGESFKGMQEDKEGNLWLLTSDKLIVKPPKGSCRIIISQKEIPDLLTSDGRGQVWGICRKSGYIARLDYTGNVTRLQKMYFNTHWEAGEHIKQFVLNSKGFFFLLSSLGNVYQGVLTGKITQRLDCHGLLDDCSLLKALVDETNLWILTNNKLIKYDYIRHLWNVYRTSDENMGVDVFRGQSLAADGKGGVFAGGHNGILHIPSEIGQTTRTMDYDPRITDVKVQNQSVFFSSAGEDGTTARKVILKPGSRNIEIFMSALKYGIGDYHELAYKLTGVDKSWVTLADNRHTAFYNQLGQGTYEFHIRYRNSYGQWIESNSPLIVVQLPALYETWYAELFYLVLLIAGAYVGWRRYMCYLRQKNDKRVKKKVAIAKVESLSAPSENQVILQAVMDSINKHLNDEEFDLDKLAAELMISKSTLHRRIKAITGLTPLDFIRSIKMKKASELLLTHTMNISEVAYAVGYNNPKYFTICFKEEFGKTPSQYQREPDKE